MIKSRVILFGFFSLLLIMVGLIIYGESRTPTSSFHRTLAEILPPAPTGWTRTERPIADTPEMQTVINELLNFDDGAFYDYTNGNLRLTVYVTYWRPGKMSSRLVAGHTPDVCWLEAGWSSIQSSQIRPNFSNGEVVYSRGEARTFTINEKREYVWFWHMVDGVSQSYGTNSAPPWFTFLTDLFSNGLNQRTEQFFIRLSSPVPLTSPELRPVLNSVMATLPLSVQDEV